MFDNDFGKCGPVFKIFPPGDSQENSLYIHHKDFHLTYSVLLHYLVEVENPKNVTDFDRILNKMLTCSWGHFEELI